MNRWLTTLLFAVLPLAAFGQDAATPSRLTRHLPAAQKALEAYRERSGPAAFSAFWRALHDSASSSGDEGLADTLSGVAPATRIDPLGRRLAGEVLRSYLQARYGAALVADLRTMITFQTYAQEGRENWDLPEFVRQRQWLQTRAESLGLTFRSVDGRVEEITLPRTERDKRPEVVDSIGLLTHGDVQGVTGQEWSSPPFAAEIVGDRLIGRGSEDDKGPIIAALYSLVALADTGWVRPHDTRLLIANAEESSWEEITYYLARNPPPTVTLGLDAAYPVTHAQKGYGVVTVRAEAGAPGTGGPLAAGLPRWRLLQARGGSGLSIIPERGEAFLLPPGTFSAELSAARAELEEKVAAWRASRPETRLEVGIDWPVLQLTAFGRGGHSSAPESGHNALGDLVAFLATLDLELDPWGSLVTFLGRHVGTETDGNSLGLRHQHPILGPLTVSLAFLETVDDLPQARLNTRVPTGLSAADHDRRVRTRAEAFTKETGGRVTATAALLSEPHLVQTDGALVSSLLAVWQEVTGKSGQPVAIGGGTQARLFPGGVDFGPAEDMVHYRGHGTDEYLTPAELERIAALTVTALLRLQSGPLPKP